MKGVIINNKNVTMIPIDNIKPNVHNTYDTSDYEDLKGSIQICGLIEPLVVIGSDENGMYTIMSGERRYKSLCSIRKENPSMYEMVPCYICGSHDMDELTQKYIIETANIETRDVNKEERRFEIIRLLHQMNQTANHSDFVKLAEKHMKCSKRYAQMYAKVFNNENEDVKNLVISKRITIAEASRLSNMDENVQTEIIEYINQGDKFNEALKKARAGRNNNDPADKDVEVPAATPTIEINDKKNEAEPEISDDELELKELKEQFFANDNDNLGNFSVDTTGRLTLMNKNTEEKTDKIAYTVIKWCEQIMQGDGTYTDADEKAIECIRELIDYLDGNEF